VSDPYQEIYVIAHIVCNHSLDWCVIRLQGTSERKSNDDGEGRGQGSDTKFVFPKGQHQHGTIWRWTLNTCSSFIHAYSYYNPI